MNETPGPGPRCYFGFRSPYSRLGLHKLARAGYNGELIAFTGPPDDAGGFADPTANKYKLAYAIHDVARMTARMKLPITLPEPFDVDFAPANRAFQAAKREGAAMGFALSVSDARWADGLDISDPAVLAECALRSGWEPPEFDALEADAEINAMFKADRAKIAADGVFGVPFLVDDGQPYWGHDRFDLWIEAKT
ncbi:hypothetical protein AY599_06935 [Leptolyngbya valderiana BDU 20041]|nr:hypothetical protein AY599_06935 [Leptolyngbya valderiana BDU 20041]